VFPASEFKKVLTTGAIDYVRKPIDERELISRVKTALALNESLIGIKQSKDSVQAKGHFLASLMEEASSPVFYLDRLGCLLDCNESFENLINKSRSDILGKTVFDFFPEFYATDLDHNFSSLKDLGIVNQCQLTLIDGMGRSKNLLLSYIGFGSKSIEVVIGIIADITDLKAGA
jgi:PAS domain S-box-containing protein